MRSAFTYRFEPASRCVMCGHSKRQILGRRLNGHQGFRPRKQDGIAVTIVQCEGCGLIYADPRPVPESVDQHYGKPPELYWRESQLVRNDQAGGALPVEVFESLWHGTGQPVRALDVGAGLGQTMGYLSRRGYDVWGLEVSPNFRDAAIERGIDPDRLALSSVEDAEYAPRSFDLITFGAVLEHLHEPAAAIERALGWIDSEGLIFAEVPSARWLIGRFLNLTYRLRGMDYVTNLSPMHDPYHLYEFTPEAFRRHGARAGYEIAHSELTAAETFLPSQLEPIAQRIMDATGTGMQLQVWLKPLVST